MKNDKYSKEAKERWGNTAAYKQSVSNTKNWTDADYDRVKKESDELMKEIVNNMDEGIESLVIQDLIAKWRKNIDQFYDTTIEMCQNLATMYIDDNRFKDYYEKYADGLAQFMHDAIFYYCKGKTK